MNPMMNRMAPDFSSPAIGGGRFALTEWRGYIVIIHFWSMECAWSRRADVMLVYRQLTWYSKGVRIVGIAANLNEQEQQMVYEAESRHIKYPILRDWDFRIANAYKAETTPHVVVVDRQGLVRYSGGVDDATHEQRHAHTFYLDRAIGALLESRLPDPAVTKPYGCPLVRTMPSTDPLTNLSVPGSSSLVG